jgi:hypothetical protein
VEAAEVVVVLAAVQLVAVVKAAAGPVEDRKAAAGEVAEAVKAQGLQVAGQAQQERLPVVVEATHLLQNNRLY